MAFGSYLEWMEDRRFRGAGLPASLFLAKDPKVGV
jgi:hypothetical protein